MSGRPMASISARMALQSPWWRWEEEAVLLRRNRTMAGRAARQRRAETGGQAGRALASGAPARTFIDDVGFLPTCSAVRAGAGPAGRQRGRALAETGAVRRRSAVGCMQADAHSGPAGAVPPAASATQALGERRAPRVGVAAAAGGGGGGDAGLGLGSLHGRPRRRPAGALSTGADHLAASPAWHGSSTPAPTGHTPRELAAARLLSPRPRQPPPEVSACSRARAAGRSPLDARRHWTSPVPLDPVPWIFHCIL